MNTNFFSRMAQMKMTGVLHFTVAKGGDDNLVVSVMLNNEGCGDKAKDLIPPYTLRGTAQELDEEFFQRIATPLQSASGLMDNMEAFLKQMEQAKKQSAMEKEKADKEKQLKEEKDKKYKDAFAKAEKLEGEKKYREAWTALPKVSEYPEHAETIRKKQTVYEKQFAPSLFETATEATPEPPQAETPDDEINDTENNDDYFTDVNDDDEQDY